jgi:hypothetical protein
VFKGSSSGIEASEIGRSLAPFLRTRADRKAMWAAIERLDQDVLGDSARAVATGITAGTAWSGHSLSPSC